MGSRFIRISLFIIIGFALFAGVFHLANKDKKNYANNASNIKKRDIAVESTKEEITEPIKQESNSNSQPALIETSKVKNEKPTKKVISYEENLVRNDKESKITNEVSAQVKPTQESIKETSQVQPILNKSEEAENPKKEVIFKDLLSSIRGFNFPDFWVWFGYGITLMYLDEQVSGYSQGKISSIDSPQLLIRSGAMFDEKNGLDWSYKSSPGVIHNESYGIAKKENFSWKNLSMEYLRLLSDKKASDSHYHESYIKIGVQTHELISIIPSELNSTEVDILTTSLYNASLGFGYTYRTRKNSRVEMNLRYQYPLTSAAQNPNDQFKVKPVFSFDGSVGYVFEFENHVSIGTYWFGQWHDYNFEYSRNSTVYTGSQKFLNSTLDLRVGYEF